jgi:hypothetical protein
MRSSRPASAQGGHVDAFFFECFQRFRTVLELKKGLKGDLCWEFGVRIRWVEVFVRLDIVGQVGRDEFGSRYMSEGRNGFERSK